MRRSRGCIRASKVYFFKYWQYHGLLKWANAFHSSTAACRHVNMSIRSHFSHVNGNGMTSFQLLLLHVGTIIRHKHTYPADGIMENFNWLIVLSKLLVYGKQHIFHFKDKRGTPNVLVLIYVSTKRAMGGRGIWRAEGC